jgi:hypothetical protein
MKLYKLRLKEFRLGEYYVIAENELIAREILENEFAKCDYGLFSDDRKVVNIELIAREIIKDYRDETKLNFSNNDRLIIVEHLK